MNTLTDDLVLPTTIVERLEQLTVEKQLDAGNHVNSNDVNVMTGDDLMTDECNIKVVTHSGLTTDKVTDLHTDQLNKIPDFVNAEVPLNDQTGADDNPDVESRTHLINEQKNDASLKQCWALLERGKGNFCLQGDVLMRSEKVLGQKYRQVVVPISRRQQCLEFGHDLAVICRQRRFLSVFI